MHLLPRYQGLSAVWPVILLSLLPVTTSATREIPHTVKEDTKLQLQFIGNATVRWMGLALYEASLWSESALFDGTGYSDAVMLSITYHKNISRGRLLDVTEEQWRNLNTADPEKRNMWLKQLHGIWPDVTPGDVIAAIVMRDGETRFYSQSELLGSIKDPEFGPGFLSIWLSPESKLPKARRQLLNLKGS